MRLKIDFGSGYNPSPKYKTCDITFLPQLDYVYDEENNSILQLEEESVDVFRLKNVLHHIKDMKRTLCCLRKYLKKGGLIYIIEPCKEAFSANVFLDNLWYRGICPHNEIWISNVYRDYFNILKSLNFEKLKIIYINEKEVSLWKKL